MKFNTHNWKLNLSLRLKIRTSSEKRRKEKKQKIIQKYICTPLLKEKGGQVNLYVGHHGHSSHYILHI